MGLNLFWPVYNYVSISFRFQANTQDTKQSVKRDKRKEGDGVKPESAIAFIFQQDQEKAYQSQRTFDGT